MKDPITDAEIAGLIASLPYYTVAKDFNRKVLAAAGIGAREALPARWKLWAERAVGTMAACWLGTAAFSVSLLVIMNIGDILPVLADPRAFSACVKFYALKAGFLAVDVLGFLSLAKALVVILAGRLNLLPYLAGSTLLAGSVILALSRHPAYARPGAARR
ncbi:MAG: hypothetical protein HY796_07815 [Elusimicrobia bacterium]|nr:hypothetical protein [Elusimicrobiota bacterium]